MVSNKEKKLKVTLRRSMNGRLSSHQACARGLGLRRMHHSVVVNDTECVRGMINKINYLLQVEEI
ncbi:MAG: 50S ribosomal protein L30 [Gammaproteobacteria bacterium]